jgi:hypothetical protein
MTERADIQDDELLNCRQVGRALRLGITDLKRMRLAGSGPPFVTRNGSAGDPTLPRGC